MAAKTMQAMDIMGSSDAVVRSAVAGTVPGAKAIRLDKARCLGMADRPKRPSAPSDGGRDGSGTGTAVLTRTRTRKPNLYRVLLLNDDYTPMEFVVHVLERFFQKDRAAATQIMMHVHQNGVGECGVFTYEVAETKVTLVMDLARKHMHPLQCVMEKK